MTRIACYIQRSHSGSAIVAVRLVAPGFDRQWTPPGNNGGGMGSGSTNSPGTDSNAEGGGGRDGTPPVAIVHAAADWIAENLSALNTKTLNTICVDPDGSVCTWLSAPSPEPKVIAATMAQLSLTDADAASGAAGRLAMLSSSDPSTALSELSIQALAVAEPDNDAGAARTSRASRRRSGKPALRAPSSRFALLSVPDSPIRVLIDALDERSIQVGSVVTLWHAISSEFDPAARAMPGFDGDHRAGGSGSHTLVSATEVPSAILMLDPIGRLVWSWSLGGKLIAGGSMRLKRVSIRRPSAGDEVSESTLDPDGARRLSVTGTPGVPEAAEYDERFECSTPEVGRLVLDWLSWGAQLGQGPQRVVCIGPQTVSGTLASISLRPASSNAPVDPALSGAAPGFAEALAAAWPGATYDFVEHNDPIGLALQRLTSEAVRGSLSAPTESGKSRNTESATIDPRLQLAALSSRPGRAHRAMYRWAAAAILAGAVVLIGLGFQLRRSAARSVEAINAARTKQAEVLASVATILPGIATSKSPEKDLTTRLADLKRQADATNPPHPMIPELVRLLTAFTQVRDKLPAEKQSELRITDVSLNPVTATCRMQVPDSITGPDIEIALGALPGQIRWTGQTPRGSGLFLLQGFPGQSSNRPAGGTPATTTPAATGAASGAANKATPVAPTGSPKQ